MHKGKNGVVALFCSVDPDCEDHGFNLRRRTKVNQKFSQAFLGIIVWRSREVVKSIETWIVVGSHYDFIW